MNQQPTLRSVDSKFDGSDTPKPRIKMTKLLTRREKQVALLLVNGKKNREIADELGISVKTIDTHRGKILRKLELRNNVELVWEAIRRGWVSWDGAQPADPNSVAGLASAA